MEQDANPDVWLSHSVILVLAVLLLAKILVLSNVVMVFFLGMKNAMMETQMTMMGKKSFDLLISDYRCSSTCEHEVGWNCINRSGSNTLCSEICGDGMWLGGLPCDDGNKVSGDGCSKTC